MSRRPPISTRTDTPVPPRRSSGLWRLHEPSAGPGAVYVLLPVHQPFEKELIGQDRRLARPQPADIVHPDGIVLFHQCAFQCTGIKGLADRKSTRLNSSH